MYFLKRGDLRRMPVRFWKREPVSRPVKKIKVRRRSHIDPVGYHARVAKEKARKVRDDRVTTSTGLFLMRSLARTLDGPRRSPGIAERLLSEYTHAQLGHALYVKCQRIVAKKG